MSLLSVDSLSVMLIFLYSSWSTGQKYTRRHLCSGSLGSRSTGDRCGPRSSHPAPADYPRGKKSCLCARIGRPTADRRPDMSKILLYPRSTVWSAGSRGWCRRRAVRTDHGRLGADPWQGPAWQPIGLAEMSFAFLYEIGMITQAQVVGFWLSRRPQLRSISAHSVRFLSLVFFMGTVGTVYLMRFFNVSFHEFNSILYRTEGGIERNRRSYFPEGETDTGDVSTFPLLYEYII